MILPGKHIRQDRSLLGVGGKILANLKDDDRTISELWYTIRLLEVSKENTPLSFDWFVLSLTFLYSINAIEFAHGVLSLRKNS